MATTNMLAGNFAGLAAIYQSARLPARSSANPTNVNYDYRVGGALVTPADFLQNIANLQLDPRAPVFVRTNRPGRPPASEFRFYLDLKSQRTVETNGFYFPYDEAGVPIGTNVLFFVGDLGMDRRPREAEFAALRQ